MPAEFVGPDGEIYRELSQREKAFVDAMAGAQAEVERLRAVAALWLDRIERDRGEPDKVLAQARSLRAALAIGAKEKRLDELTQLAQDLGDPDYQHGTKAPTDG